MTDEEGKSDLHTGHADKEDMQVDRERIDSRLLRMTERKGDRKIL
jgi:hypothetical protein